MHICTGGEQRNSAHKVREAARAAPKSSPPHPHPAARSYTDHVHCYECEPRTAQTVVDTMKKLEQLPCCANGVPESPNANETGLIIEALGGTALQPLSCAANRRTRQELLRGVRCKPPMWGGDTNAPTAVHALAKTELALDGPLHVFKSVATDMWDAMFELLSTADRAVLGERISGLLNGHEVRS